MRLLVRDKGVSVVNLDKLTYAGNTASLTDLDGDPNYAFEPVDLCDTEALQQVFEQHQPDSVIHLAAESHVDRSIDGPGEFIQTNIVGTFNLLQASLQYWRNLPEGEPDEQSAEFRASKSVEASDFSISESQPFSLSQKTFRFLHVSTDEVYGSLSTDAPGFSETHAYDPHSPYSASKAASDHLVRAWSDTYGLPTLVTNCSNNYGPYQFPEKLIPTVILKCLRGEPIPVYGKGENIRDWLYVTDHAEALYAVLTKGRIGETYNIGGNNERQNIELVRALCQLMDELQPAFERGELKSVKVAECEGAKVDSGEGVKCLETHSSPVTSHNLANVISSYEELITFVTDRPGHDMRYAIDATKIRNELGWEPKENFESGFRKTVQWYLENQDWSQHILSGDYQLERLGKD